MRTDPGHGARQPLCGGCQQLINVSCQLSAVSSCLMSLPRGDILYLGNLLGAFRQNRLKGGYQGLKNLSLKLDSRAIAKQMCTPETIIEIIARVSMRNEAKKHQAEEHSNGWKSITVYFGEIWRVIRGQLEILTSIHTS